MEVGALKKKSFHELYPDPRLQPMHQDIAIPNIMVDITRESYCKPEWAVFQECLDSHTLVERTKGQAIQKTKDLLMGSCDEVWDLLFFQIYKCIRIFTRRSSNLSPLQ